ncbi:hypothetical protein FOCC_FOCC000877 [Frankliniella occidentalis]|nr:hypothetical protein FOCC_FOCC000877 [Frankliniella occidentalis]
MLKFAQGDRAAQVVDGYTVRTFHGSTGSAAAPSLLSLCDRLEREKQPLSSASSSVSEDKGVVVAAAVVALGPSKSLSSSESNHERKSVASGLGMARSSAVSRQDRRAAMASSSVSEDTGVMAAATAAVAAPGPNKSLCSSESNHEKQLAAASQLGMSSPPRQNSTSVPPASILSRCTSASHQGKRLTTAERSSSFTVVQRDKQRHEQGGQELGQHCGGDSRRDTRGAAKCCHNFNRESSPPSASTAAPLSPSWHTAGHLWSPPHPPPVASPMRAFPQGVHHEGRDLPAFGERTAAAAVEEAMDMGALGTSTYPSPSAAGSEPTSATIDNLVALTQLLCLTDGPRSEPRLLPSNYNNNRNHFWGQRRPLKNQIAFCAFCKGNGELPSLYNDHRLHAKQPDGTMRVECPVLQRLKYYPFHMFQKTMCEICGATGAYAHTRSHCPYNRQPSVAVLLKKTPRRCDGSLRSYRK